MATLILITVTAVALGLYYLRRIGRREADLPPGPPTKPLLGNLHLIPTSNVHFQFTEWAQQYGGIYSLKLAHATAIVLTDRRLIRELVDKKGAIYNSRPENFIVQRYVSRDPANNPLLVFSQYGEKLRLGRKILSQHFNEVLVEEKQVPIIEAEAAQMLYDTRKEPDELRMHIMRMTNSLVKALVYGTRTKHAYELHAYAAKFEPYTKILETGAIPPVDLLPWLEYVPQWLFTGAWKNWKIKGDESGRAVNAGFNELAEPVLARRNRGVNDGTLYDYLLDQWEGEKGIDFTRRDLDIFAGSLIDAGTDTTASSIATAIQAMVKYPHVQRKAHASIDGVVGGDRSPRWSDVTRLPYIVQIVKETLRWRPLATVMPHATTADDTIDGYFIPKNTMVILNIWGLNHTPASASISSPTSNKESPLSEFDPDRFATRTQLSPFYAASSDFAARDHYTYGAGRRICPGMHLAERTLCIAIAKLLWAFEFNEKPGKPVDVDPRTGYTEGIVRAPIPFECEVLVRKGREEVVEREFKGAESVLGRFEW